MRSNSSTTSCSASCWPSSSAPGSSPSAIVLMSSGLGAIIGAYVWGWLADRIGRRKVFIGTVLNFSIATGLLYFTPDNGWVYLTIMRFFVGVGVGGLYCVDLPLVQ